MRNVPAVVGNREHALMGLGQDLCVRTRGHDGPPVRKNLSSEAPNEWQFLLVSVDFAGAAAATISVAVSHQRSCPLDHVIQIELGNLAPIGQHRRSR